MNSGSSPHHERPARDRVVRVFAIQGLIGLAAMVVLTIYRFDQTVEIVRTLGSEAWLLISIFFVVAAALQLLKFELTDLIFVSLGIAAYVAMYPLLGGVISSWTAVSAAMITRWLGMNGIGPVKVEVSDRGLEYLKVFGLFGTYGLPIVLASVAYEMLGGVFPLLHVSPEAVLRLAICGIALILTNTIVLSRAMEAYGYNAGKRIDLLYHDASLYLLTLPYAISVTLSYGALGIGAVIALAFTGILANVAARSLAITRRASQQQLQRLASLSNIGMTISLQFTTDQLLKAIYTECRKVVDTSLFSIALLDEQNGELSFELDVRDDEILPRERIPMGTGLNSWVVAHGQPLLLGSIKEERALGLMAVDDGLTTESWLGVPMIARDHVIGVMAVQSYRKNAFSHDDIVLMMSIATQAAVALENAKLYKDLEGLTYALEQRVLERTKELNETNLRLLAADRSKNQFLANMSHDLRTPLNSIIGFSSVLLDNSRENMPPRMYRFLENIRTAGNHLLELINDILDLSKIEAGKMELRPEWFDLRETVAAVERVMRGFAADANVRISVSIDPAVPKVRLDEGRLKQILFNLTSNAIKFSPRGGPVQIGVTPLGALLSPIHVDSVRIEVRDQGVGIAKEEIDRIFDEFYQSEGAPRNPKGGTGLGLPLTRNFVELHHGTIEVDSVPGEGSTFVLVLPVDYEEAAGLRGRSGAVRQTPRFAQRAV